MVSLAVAGLVTVVLLVLDDSEWLVLMSVISLVYGSDADVSWWGNE